MRSLKPWPQPITSTRQARKARKEARLDIIRGHDTSVLALRKHLEVHFADDPERATDTAATINYHLDRMEYHLEHIEAGT